MEPFGVSFFDIFLHAKKDIATGGRRFSREVGKNVKSKISPPEVVGLVERLVKNVQRKTGCREANALGVPPEGVRKAERWVISG